MHQVYLEKIKYYQKLYDWFFSESKKGKEGCETIYVCCRGDLKSEGCKQVCKKCGVTWGNRANDCYSTTLKPHDLERVEQSV